MDDDCEVVGVTTCSTDDDYKGAGATSSAEDDCEVVSVTAGDPFVFHPLHPFAKQFMCNKRLWITNVKNATVPRAIDILPLGQPCKRTAIKGDGNCFFRAISQVLSGTEDNHETIRAALVSEMRLTNAEYVQESGMDRVGVWATEVEIEALAAMLSTRIYTYYRGRWLRTCRKGMWKGSIYLNNDDCHYEPVLCTKSTCGAVCNRCDRGVRPPIYVDVAQLPEHPGSPGSVVCCSSEKEPRCAHREQVEDVECREQTVLEFVEEAPSNIPDYHGQTGRYQAHPSVEFDDEALGESSVYHEQAQADYNKYLPVDGDERLDPQCNRTVRPWTLLAETWHAFLAYADEGWWGDVCLSTVASCMDLGADGDIAITAALSSDPGIVCSVTVRAFPSMVTHNVVLSGCRFQCDTVPNETFSSPITCVHRIVSTVTRPVILARPNGLNDARPSSAVSTTHSRADRKLPVRLFGAPCRETSDCWLEDLPYQPVSLTRMIEDMRSLTDSPIWFRLAYGEETDCVTPDCIVGNLRQTDPRAGVVVYNLSRNIPGYLFDIVTAERTWFVTFSQHLGYVLTNDGPSMFFRAMDSLMSYVHRYQHVLFVSETELFLD